MSFSMEAYSNSGFTVCDNLISDLLLKDLEETIVALYCMQAYKFLSCRNKIKAPLSSNTSVDKLDDALILLEEIDREAAYQVLPMLNSTSALKKAISSPELNKVCAQIFNCDPKFILSDSSFFANLPKSERLLYKWHAERHSYPKRESVINVWIPLFRDKNRDNGTMYMAERSHKLKDLPFSEYRGYNLDTFKKANHFIQTEIPESFLDGCSAIPIEAKRGQCVFFHKDLVHKSSHNNSDKPSYALVLRFWHPCHDLTLSGNIATRPYGQDYSSPGIDSIRNEFL